MSRTIDRASLSKDDAIYLHQRAQLSDEEYAKHLSSEDLSLADDTVPLADRPNTGDVNTYAEQIEDMEKRLRLMKLAQTQEGEDFTGFEDSDPPSRSADFDPDDVDTWTKAQREQVLGRFQIDAADSKRAQVRALDAYRRENPDADFSVTIE